MKLLAKLSQAAGIISHACCPAVAPLLEPSREQWGMRVQQAQACFERAADNA